MSGGTSAQSRANLAQWLDDVAVSLGLQYSLVYDEDSHRVPGLFQHLAPEDAAKFKRVIQNKTRGWQQNSITAGLSCRSFVEAGGGQGSGKGTLFLSPFELGPFLGQ